MRVHEDKNLNGKLDKWGNLSWPKLDRFRDFDILLFSTEDLITKNSQQIKKICDAKFLLKMRNNPSSGQFLGLVYQQRKKD